MGATESSQHRPQIQFGHQNHLSFFVNGIEYKVNLDGNDPEFGPNYMLLDYIRERIGLTGTKYLCRKGECGACTVMVKSIHPFTAQQVTRSVNSCLLPLYSCDGLDVTTIEGVGNSREGYHPIQDSLVKFGGIQCGFCSPGLVMNMYSYSLVNPGFTGGNVEYSLDGNYCRCTGYRSIMDAFKSLSKSTSENCNMKVQDIESCYKCPYSSKTVEEEKLYLLKPEIISTPKTFMVNNKLFANEWIKVTNLTTLFEILERFLHEGKEYQLVAGNTGKGVYKNDEKYSAYIDINDIPELHNVFSTESGLVLGGAASLTEAIDLFMTVAKKDGFVYATEFAKHFRRIGSLTIRNSGTLAGNLMLKHDNPEFPSDIFTLFEAVGGTVRIASSPILIKDYSLTDFLRLTMTGKVIMAIHLPTFSSNNRFRCFKIARRYQNSHAHVNAAMLFEIEGINDNLSISGKPSICYGGISPTFIHATATEKYLSDKQLNTKSLQRALKILQQEAVGDHRTPSSSPEYRTGLAQSLLYKFFLGLLRESLNPFILTGADDVDRGLNSGTQVFDTDKSKWPLYQPVPKVESYPQVSGEAEFIDDIQIGLNELFGAFVISTVAVANIASVNATEALKIPGVVAFITSKDVPGSNNYAVFGSIEEEIFASKKILYCGQSIGLIVAENKFAAFKARDKVKVVYENVKKPITDIKEAITNQHNFDEIPRDPSHLAFPCRGISANDAKLIVENMMVMDEDKRLMDKGNVGILHKIKGEFITRGQYHGHLENQTCLCFPREDGVDVYSSTQSLDNIQAVVASALGIQNNSVNVFIRRVGGSFGGKCTKANLIAAACSIAAYKTNRAVRIVLDLETNMKMIGKRLPYLTKYEASVTELGKIETLNATLYCDVGAVANEPSSLFAAICFQSCYKSEKWKVRPAVAVTDTAPNTFCRSPGSAQAIAAVENIMEHIAHVTQRDPLEIRQINYIHKGDTLIGIPGAKLMTENPLPEIIEKLKLSSEYEKRQNFIRNYNASNRWRKRGLSLVPQRIPIQYADLRLPTFVSVYHVDGTVNISHSGLELGQAINTKVIQVVASTLSIPLESVKVKPTMNYTSPNTAFTAASVTSELVCYSAKKACELMLEKMEPVKKELGNPTWPELVKACNSKGILLTAQYQATSEELTSYDVWGATVIEVEVDVLTGDYRIIRVDIVEDAGNSINPLVDIGQIEGGFVMGLGWLLTEELVYDQNSGELLTDNTWTYKPMLPADIPEDFRITLRQNAPNPFGVFSSKAVAEPPLNMAVSVMFAIREAISSARRDAGNTDWFEMDAPISKEAIRRLALTSSEQFIT